ncbi:MAG TPA: hypothetical protein VK176_06470 [Phycisphaerales bacterium]|nr:hypothetical protein [Phycisphaerales bacterium]
MSVVCPACGYPAHSSICPECGADSRQPVANVYLLRDDSFEKRQSTRKLARAMGIVGVLAYALPMLMGVGKAIYLMATS